MHATTTSRASVWKEALDGKASGGKRRSAAGGVDGTAGSETVGSARGLGEMPDCEIEGREVAALRGSKKASASNALPGGAGLEYGARRRLTAL